ncbi:MAG TPA: pyruvate:ferredoxin (flavodoxin) oxidoreductase [Candidatus Eremiobacteraeota bacterium]|nr:MAG: Pyruvate-flavodoxin oxidoreductase [bacterium ADurb.Bin363]HPZ07625.1 pyruvate:ferredoxin (flavodoxin) oxidoreductase [Candidatus Eremiobacteraeota bacterium]
MVKQKMEPFDGNTSATYVAYAFSEVAAIYPITPSSVMGELADEWAAQGRKNIFEQVVKVIQMQSEGGAAGAVHGALSAGAMTTTFTASQGLMLMVPNMFKIAGEMLPTVFHVSARSLACQALSIFGDHSDVMATRGTGYALIAAGSVQEVLDLAIVSHLATLKSRVPFLNFFDGFRTSHEIMKIYVPEYEDIKGLVDMDYIREFRERALKPEKPYSKTGAENPDVYFQGRETVNNYYDATPGIVQEYMDKVGEKFGRHYHLFDYVGAKDAEKIIIAMGSGCETIEETVNYLIKERGEKVGAIKVRLYRPFSVEAFKKAIPATVKKIAVLDRTKEPGSIGEPLYMDVKAALCGSGILIVGGRYGLSSKEFTPNMVKAVYDHLDNECFHNFTVGITDDVSHKSIKIKEKINSEQKGIIRCKFWGLGSDGTVSANKNSIKLICDNTPMYGQAYFSYDSKKSGGITVSHLRFGKEPIQSIYLLTDVDFVACHNPAYIGRYDLLEGIREGGTFLLNSPWSSEEVFDHLTEDLQRAIIDKKLKFYNIDALKIAQEVGLGNRISTVMQAAFFKISGVLPEKESIGLMKDALKKTFAKKGEEVVKMNWDCVDRTSDALVQVKIPDSINKTALTPTLIPHDAISFAKDVIEPVMRLKGDSIPVSKMPLDGAIPTATSRLEKRGVAPFVPHWIAENCIQCNQCAFVCPHATIRAKQIDPENLKDAPETFKTIKSSTKNNRDLRYKIQVYIEDCVGCGNCVETCPAKTKALVFKTLSEERSAGEKKNAEFFDNLPDNVVDGIDPNTLKGSQFLQPLFEFSGACAGCGETPYVKLATQLFGDRMIIANATGCSSIYGGTFPTIPYCVTKEGKGPAWANSLFEDNAEYAFGFRLAVDSNRKQLLYNIDKLLSLGTINELEEALKKSKELWKSTGLDAKASAKKVHDLLPEALSHSTDESRPFIEKIIELQDYIVDKSIWAIGGDGWAYDIGYGGLDHVIACNYNVNILVLDTEVYSNTGGQSSKATPLAATAKFATAGKRTGKKDLGLMAMSYGYVYVASVAMGANRNQTLKAFLEAEAYEGPSIIIAYSPCINHGINMRMTQDEQKLAVEAGYWPIYRYDPRLARDGKNPLIFEAKDPKVSFDKYIKNENRYRTLTRICPGEAEALFEAAEKDAKRRFEYYKKLASL